MEDLSRWKEKFEECIYAKKLLDKLKYLNTKVANPVDFEEVKKAIYYARKYHGSQMRKSGDPYYSHPIEVAIMVAEFTVFKETKFFTTDNIITSLLHDTIEDTQLTQEMIAYIFNENIAVNVEALTRIKIDTKISAADAINILYRSAKMELIIIKLFDRLHNLQTIGAKPLEKQINTIRETLISFLPVAVTVSYQLENKIVQLCLNILNELDNKYEEDNYSFRSNNSSQHLPLIF
ncbi:HD domain-containing protein [Rickettsia bellii]|uniref:HD domain protein n=1 Tax=Rickettsia bellii str. RML Mogi TaxID=1359194 RepID=A0A0F3QHE4_RICBE|nr:HD domain-containing protein [Rickettsia bellii]KJV91672.1 HD domain protein [Rickettsia bellii str. RML Mogi]